MQTLLRLGAKWGELFHLWTVPPAWLTMISTFTAKSIRFQFFICLRLALGKVFIKKLLIDGWDGWMRRCVCACFGRKRLAFWEWLPFSLNEIRANILPMRNRKLGPFTWMISGAFEDEYRNLMSTISFFRPSIAFPLTIEFWWQFPLMMKTDVHPFHCVVCSTIQLGIRSSASWMKFDIFIRSSNDENIRISSFRPAPSSIEQSAWFCSLRTFAKVVSISKLIKLTGMTGKSLFWKNCFRFVHFLFRFENFTILLLSICGSRFGFRYSSGIVMNSWIQKLGRRMAKSVEAKWWPRFQ